MINSTNDAPANVQDAVFSILRSSILTLKLPPGSSISANEIATKMNVSRTPAREAFIRLEREGLVKIIPQRETVVSLIDPDRVRQERFFRESLELAVVEPFIDNVSNIFLKDMATLIDRQKEALDSGENDEFFALDDYFHKSIFDTARQPLSWSIILSMSGHYWRFRHLTTMSKQISENVIDQHRQLVVAAEKRDAVAMRGMLEKHLRKLLVEESEIIGRNPEYFISRENQSGHVINPDWLAGK